MMKIIVRFFILSIFFLLFKSSVFAAPTISSVTDNRSNYPESQILRHEKLEVTFQVGGAQAENFQLPYLSSSEANSYTQAFVNKGISVEGIFLPPGESDWNKAFRQPAFYYQNFIDGSDENYMYPTESYAWKVRFSPHLTGVWKYRLAVRDAGGQAQSSDFTFTVTTSDHKGFLRVSTKDPRYFEFENGTPFTGLGYNLAMHQLFDNANLAKLKENGINFIRAWLAPMNIHGTTWTAWQMMPMQYGGYLPRVPILPYEEVLGQPLEFKWYLSEGSSWYMPCAFIGHTQPFPSVKPSTQYHIRARYKVDNLSGPRDSAYSQYGFVVKVGGWNSNCRDPYKPGIDPTWAQANPVTGYGTSTSWDEVVGTWTAGANTWSLPYMYMTLENANSGSRVYIDSIEMYEMSGGTAQNPVLTGANIIDKYSSDEHLYFAQKPSYKMDKIVEKLKAYDVYVRPVVNEKEEYLFAKLDAYGNPTFQDDFNRFYGSGRNEYYLRWLQKAWWRYIQARWGYSANIHSWELINEGNPASSDHFALSDELGKFMKCGVFGLPVGTSDGNACISNHPNRHMVSTSFWHSFPVTTFWKHANYPNVDYATVHAYVSTSNVIDFTVPGCSKTEMEGDAAAYHLCHSTQLGGWKIGKPIVRGEAGMDNSGSQDPNILGIQQDTTGVWYHNYSWASLGSGGLYEQYWWQDHIVKSGVYDHRPVIKRLTSFLQTISLNNGHYQDLAASVSNSMLRVVGQKDVVNENAHLWVQNKNHTWKKVVDGVTIAPETGTITIGSFAQNKQYTLETWNTYTGTTQTTITSSDGNGTITIQISNLSTDAAYKIMNPDEIVPTLTPTLKPGDVNGDGIVNITDLSTLLSNFGKTGVTRSQGDLNGDGVVNLMDLSILLANFGK